MATVMVVDDDADVLETLGTILARSGHHILKASGGIEALHILEQGEPPDLLLTDAIMPGMDGFELARAALARCANLKVLYLTGYTEHAGALHGRGERYGKLLTKPIFPNDLRQEVNEALAITAC